MVIRAYERSGSPIMSPGVPASATLGKCWRTWDPVLLNPVFQADGEGLGRWTPWTAYLNKLFSCSSSADQAPIQKQCFYVLTVCGYLFLGKNKFSL